MPHASRTLRRPASALVFLLAASAASSAAAADPASHRQAALDLLEETGVREAFHEGFAEGLEESVGENPEMAPFREVFDEFLTKHLSWEEVREWMAGRLVRRFSEAELRELTGFYRSPLYRKMKVEMDKMIADGPAFTEKLLAEHVDELKAMMQAQRGELARDSAKTRNRSASDEQTDLLLRLARTQLDARNWREARDLLARYLALRPDDADAFSDLGLCHRELGEPRPALDAFRRAVALDPGHWRSRYNAVLVLAYDLKDRAGAERELKALEAAEPRNPEVAKLRAALGRGAGR